MNASGSSTSSGAYRSFSRKSEDALQDWESHLLLRFPPEIAQKIREYLEDESHSGNDSRMSLSINSNLHTGTLRFDKQEMPFTLYDLPCITEVMKTLDNKTVYKVADISQIIVCSPPAGDKSRREMRAGDEDAQKVATDYEWPNGLCPPMRNAKRKRFRKVVTKKYMDAADVERELKRLLRSDLEAASVRWEVMAADEPEKNISAELQYESRTETIDYIGIDEYGLSLSESDEENLQ